MLRNLMGASGPGARRKALAALSAISMIVLLPAAHAALGAPVIQTPAENAVVGGFERDVVISGTGQPGTTISLWRSPATPLGQATVGTNGVWQRSVRLANGNYSVYAVASDGAEQTPPSEVRSFTVDAVAPSVAIERPDDQHVFAPHEALRIRGEAADDRNVHAVRLEYWSLNKLMLESLAQCSGCGTPYATWSHEPSALIPGYYMVKAYAFDATANRSAVQQRGFMTLLERVPDPGITAPPVETPGVPVIEEPKPGQILPAVDHPIVIGGESDPGTSVVVTDENKGVLGIVETEQDGTWQISPRLPTGTYTVRVRAVNDTGESSVLSKLLTFSVDADRPTLTVLTDDGTVFTPLEPVVLEGKIFDNDRVAAVKLEYWLLDRLALQQWARCIGCGETEGLWRDQPNLPRPGYYHVLIKAFDRAGNPSWTSTTTFVKTI